MLKTLNSQNSKPCLTFLSTCDTKWHNHFNSCHFKKILSILVTQKNLLNISGLVRCELIRFYKYVKTCHNAMIRFDTILQTCPDLFWYNSTNLSRLYDTIWYDSINMFRLVFLWFYKHVQSCPDCQSCLDLF